MAHRGDFHLRNLLCVGDRRTVGNVALVVGRVLDDVHRLPTLVECMFDGDAAVRMRAADALEKLSRVRPRGLDAHAAALLTLFGATDQQELRWHLAVLLPRLRLSRSQRRETAEILETCLQARSSLVRTYALQGLADLAANEASLVPRVTCLLRWAERCGTPAMKARSRKLLARLKAQALQAGR